MFFVTDPGRFDVIVTDNLFGDILTDIGAAIGGGIGLAASGNLDVSRTNPSMFEPVHGSAPDIAGQGVADPTATVLSVAMLLEHLGHADEARPRGGRRRGRPGRPRGAHGRGTARGRRRAAAPAGLTPSRTCGPAAVASARREQPRAYSRRQPHDDHGTTGTTSAALPRSRSCRARPAAATASAPRSWPTPGSGASTPTTWSPCAGRRDRGWHDARLERVRPAAARPVGHGPALRTGDLRGAQGLPPARRRRRDVPPGGERPRASTAPPRAWRCRSCRRSCSSRPSTRWCARPRLGAERARRRACTCARS